MKYFVAVCYFLFVVYHVSGNINMQDEHLSATDSLTALDTTKPEVSMDSLKALYVRDSLQKNYSMILFHLRSENEQLELSLIESRRIIAVLFVLLLILVLILILLISGKALFTSFPHFKQRRGYQPAIVCLQMLCNPPTQKVSGNAHDSGSLQRQGGGTVPSGQPGISR